MQKGKNENIGATLLTKHISLFLLSPRSQNIAALARRNIPARQELLVSVLRLGTADFFGFALVTMEQVSGGLGFLPDSTEEVVVLTDTRSLPFCHVAESDSRLHLGFGSLTSVLYDLGFSANLAIQRGMFHG